ncbi:MAG: alpha/beta hydrolase [Vicinamibacterales bacterium]
MSSVRRRVWGGLLLVALVASGPAAAAETRVAFLTSDGVAIAGTYYEPSRRPAPMVLLLHMPTRNRADWTSVGRRFADVGVGTLAIDLRGHGESGAGAESEPAAALESSLRDVEAALAWLSRRPEAIPGRVGLVGASAGANLAVLAAAADPSVHAVVLLSVTLDFRGLRTAAGFQKLGTRPALLIASREDSYAARSARELSSKVPTLHEFWLLEEAGHGSVIMTRRPDLVSSMVDWLSARLL